MALEGTHLRFALDIKDKYRISDLNKYLSGTIYPDSRYITGIDRNLTHPEDFLDNDFFQEDDFKKGWFVHLLCDKIQYNITTQKFPAIFANEDKFEVWADHSALKILQDIEDIKKFDIVKHLPALDYVKNPNGEEIEKLRGYNKMFQKMYADPSGVDVEVCCDMWKELGVNEEYVDKIREKVKEYRKNLELMEFVRDIYDDMLLEIK